MKTIIYKLIILLTIAPALAFCSNSSINDNFKGRYTKEKKITKKYKVSPDAILKISNSYGNIDISTLDQNMVSIEVIVKTNGNDEEKVRQKLDDIQIQFDQTTNGVAARTIFTKENSSFWNTLFGSDSNVNMEINYIIRAPVTNNVDLNNDYGSIFIDKLTGNSKISCDYGRLDIGELHGTSNIINFDYSRNSHIGYIKKGTINADYSDFTVDDAGSLELNADYTKSNIKKVELINFNCDYGSLHVDKLKRIVGNGDYLSTRIGQIHQSADLSLDYGSIEIDRIVKGAGDIKISTDYAGIKIGYAENLPFQFTVNTSYGNVKGLDNFQINKRNQSNTKESYSGFYLNSSASSNIVINSTYAGVTFQRR